MKKSIALVLASTLTAAVAFGAFAGDKDTGTKTGDKHAAQKHETKTGEAKTDKKAETTKVEIGKAAPNFTLKTTEGKEWSLTDAKGHIVVLEWCNPECPACQRVTSDGTVAESIKGAKDAASDVVYVMINSSAASESSLKATAGYLKEHHVDVPALLDSEGKVGMMYGARTTPHIFVIDDKGVLRYQGAIDDGGPAKKGTMNYVANAVKQIKAGETVAPDSTTPYGCGVKYKK